MPKSPKGWIMFMLAVAVSMAVINRIPQVKQYVG